MASCKDCIHERVCEKLYPKGLLPYQSSEYPAESFCLEFKNKADIVEVEHGYWIKGKRIGINVPQYTCSKCGKWEDAEFPYCHCGAKMDGTPKERGEYDG